MASEGSGNKILVIDDDHDLAFALKILLERSGYAVVRAAEGEEGLKMAAEEKPDLIILDFMMPVRDGFSVCNELSGDRELQSVPVIALTAFGQRIGETHGLTKEAVSCVCAFIEKPYEANVLLQRIASALAEKYTTTHTTGVTARDPKRTGDSCSFGTPTV